MAQPKITLEQMSEEQFVSHLERIDELVPVYMDIYEKKRPIDENSVNVLMEHHQESRPTVRNLTQDTKIDCAEPRRLIWVRDPFTLIQAAQIIEGKVHDFSEYADSGEILYGSELIGIIHNRRKNEADDPWDRYEHDISWGQYEALFFLNLECYPTSENFEALEKWKSYRDVMLVCGAHTITSDGTILACPTVDIQRNASGQLDSVDGEPSLYGLYFHNDNVIHPYVTTQDARGPMDHMRKIPYTLHNICRGFGRGPLDIDEVIGLPIAVVSIPIGKDGKELNLTLSDFKAEKSTTVPGAVDLSFDGSSLPKDLDTVTQEFVEVCLGRPLWGVDGSTKLSMTVAVEQIRKPAGSDILQVMQGLESQS